MESTNFCSKCELNALERLLTPENIRKDVANLAYIEGITAPSAVYEKRLEVCAECPALNGHTTCAHSGSLVAYRAKILNTVCPWPGNNKWVSAD